MKKIIVAAMTKDKVIGNGNMLPWDLPKERELFKKITEGNTVIMGKNTFLSIGSPLPNRNNIIVSTTLHEKKGYSVCRSLDKAIKAAEKIGKDIFIIGGSDIYRQSITKADEMHLSIVKGDYDGNIFFPDYSEDYWEIAKGEDHEEFELIILKRKTEESKHKHFSINVYPKRIADPQDHFMSWRHKHPLIVEEPDFDTEYLWV